MTLSPYKLIVAHMLSILKWYQHDTLLEGNSAALEKNMNDRIQKKVYRDRDREDSM